MNWILEHGSSILEWIGGIVSCASIIVGLTPTTKDNTALDAVVKVLDNFSIFNTANNRKKLDK